MKLAEGSHDTTKMGATVPERLLCSGELLIGEKGLDGASLRQICIAAGTKNHYSVQYHFGDMPGLIRAILARRLPEIERRRAQALADAGDATAPTSRNMIEIFMRPLIDCVYDDEGRPLFTADGEPVFARFMLALNRTVEGWKPLDDMYDMMPSTQQILGLLERSNPDVPLAVLWKRLHPITTMVLNYACSHRVENLALEDRELLLADLFDMAAAALATPVQR